MRYQPVITVQPHSQYHTIQWRLSSGGVKLPHTSLLLDLDELKNTADAIYIYLDQDDLEGKLELEPEMPFQVGDVVRYVGTPVEGHPLTNAYGIIVTASKTEVLVEFASAFKYGHGGFDPALVRDKHGWYFYKGVENTSTMDHISRLELVEGIKLRRGHRVCSLDVCPLFFAAAVDFGIEAVMVGHYVYVPSCGVYADAKSGGDLV